MLRQLLKSAIILLVFFSLPVQAMTMFSETTGVYLFANSDEGYSNDRIPSDLKDQEVSIVLNPTEAVMLVGDTMTIEATIIQPENTIYKRLTWTSRNESVATVNENGLVTAVAPGDCSILASYSYGLFTVTAECLIHVQRPAESVALNITNATLQVGETLGIIATVSPEDATNKDIEWASSDENVASVDDDGMVTALAPGVCNITASCGDVFSTCTITVKEPVVLVESIVIEPEKTEVEVGETITIEATIVPQNPSDGRLTWKSSDTSIATVTEHGLLMATLDALAPGQCVITAECYNTRGNIVKDSCMITVKAPVVLPESVELNYTEAELAVGESLTLTATVLPENVTDPSVSWQSSDNNIATVNDNGVVTAVAPGECDITASCGDVSATCHIIVPAPVVLPESVELNYTEAELAVGESLTLTATVLPENVTDPSVSWQSSDNTIATVGDNGVVTAVAPGECDITASCGNVSATCHIIVPIPVVLPESIELNYTEAELSVGESLTLVATVLPENVTDPSVSWQSSDNTIATVGDNGVVTAVAPGECDITASCGDVSVTCHIIVPTPVVLPESIELNYTEAELSVGESLTLVATVLPENVTDPSVSWQSSDNTIATVDNNGVVTAVAPGECDITASCGDVSVTCHIIVPTPVVLPESIELNYTEAELSVGESLTLTATVSPEDVTDPSVSWQSSDNTVATVDNNGVVTAVAPGECDITASCGDVSATCHIIVLTPIVLPESVELNYTEAELAVGESLTLVATVLPENVTDPSVSWQSSDNAIATVDNNGVVTAVATGECNIMASCGDVSATCHIIVHTPVVLPESVELNYTEAELSVGESLTLIATVLPENVTDPNVLWQSSDNTIATVDDNGVVTAVAPGECDITASCGDASGTCHITVSVPVVLPESIELDPTEAVLAIDETLSIIAKVLPENVTDPSVLWQSSDNTIATVDDNGVVTAVAPGDCNVTATCGEVSSICHIKVYDPADVVITLDDEEVKLLLGLEFELVPTVDSPVETELAVTSSDTTVVMAQVADGKVTLSGLDFGKATITVSSQDGKAQSASCDVVVSKLFGDVDGDGVVSISDITSLVDMLLSGDDTSIEQYFIDVDMDGSINISDLTELIDQLLSGDDDVFVIVPESISLNMDSVNINLGSSITLEACILPEDVTNTFTYWTSSNGSVAKVSDGVVTAAHVGECDIFAVCRDQVASCHVVVSDIAPEYVVLDKDNVNLLLGEEVTLVATVYPDNVTDKTVVWSSTNGSVATVANGKVTALGVGDCYIIADCQGKRDTCCVNVYAIDPESVVLSQHNASMLPGETFTLTATVYPENVTNKTVVWSSTDESVATVSNGKVTAVSVGNCFIIADCQGKRDTCSVNVYVVEPECVVLNQHNASMLPGETITLTAMVYPENVTDKTVVWSTTNESVATVSNGKVTAVAVGDCYIIADCQGKRDTCSVNVYVIEPERVVLSQHSASMLPGEKITLTATVYPENTTNKAVVWSTTNRSVATVSNGKVTAVAVGDCFIIADCQGKRDTCSVNVYVVNPESVVLSQTSATMGVGEVLNLTATVYPENATNNTVTWSSSATAVATVNQGVVKAIGIGECDITATCQTLRATCHIKVEDDNAITVKGVTFNMVFVEGGTFTIGSPATQVGSSTMERPQHEVTLSSFKIGQTEVTQELWEAVMGNNPSGFKGDSQRPVENVSWEDCQKFIDSLNVLTGKHFRLPTEAEWEFAARGGNQSQGYTFAGSNTAKDVAWYSTNSNGTTHPVAQKLPNELGLYDMSGNVSEWCSDWYEAYTAEPQTNPTGPATGSYKVYRSGDYDKSAAKCRPPYRDVRQITYHLEYLGLRLAL